MTGAYPIDTGPEALRNIQEMDKFNAWMYGHFSEYIGQRILEVGSGTGNLTQFFIDRPLVVGTDIMDEHLQELTARFRGHANFRCLRADFMEDVVPLLRDYRFDTIVSTNVLEHIADDRKALRNMFDVLSPDGNLVILVPAFRFLYGSLDVNLLHHRRYTRKELTEKIASAGFTNLRTRWMNVAGIAGWFIDARIRKVPSIPAGQLRTYEKLVPLFRFVENIIGPPVGLSLIVIARKP